jgi:hypothetical protein
MALNDGRERLTRAVGILADEKERIKQRLLTAYASQLSRVNAQEDLPPDLLEEFCQLRNAISDAEMPYGYGERAAKKIQSMNEEEASALARSIFKMFLKFSATPTEPTAA